MEEFQMRSDISLKAALGRNDWRDTRGTGDKLRDLLHYPAHRDGGGLSFTINSVSRQREQTQDAYGGWMDKTH